MTPAFPGPSHVLPLWPEGAPGNEDWGDREEECVLPGGLQVVRNVTRPTLTAYLPDPAIATGTAVIVCPGGAFHFLAYVHEGIEVARWLNERGVAAFMLKYRLIQTGDDFPGVVFEHLQDREKMKALEKNLLPQITADGLQAVRMVRAHAAEWGIAPGKVGILGFSAGGVVTTQVALLYDATSRPDFAAPIYGAYPQETPIPADAPPLFLLCAGDDDMAVPISLKLYSDWRAGGHAAELHIYAKGGHGFGMNRQGLPSDHWIERFADWLGSQGL
jgi:acetyl esterase/lipase